MLNLKNTKFAMELTIHELLYARFFGIYFSLKT